MGRLHEFFDHTANPWGHLKPIFPTAAGRMELALVQEASDFYSGQVVLIAGGSLIRQGKDVVATCRRFMEQVQGCGPALLPHSPASTSCWATPMIFM